MDGPERSHSDGSAEVDPRDPRAARVAAALAGAGPVYVLLALAHLAMRHEVLSPLHIAFELLSVAGVLVANRWPWGAGRSPGVALAAGSILLGCAVGAQAEPDPTLTTAALLMTPGATLLAAGFLRTAPSLVFALLAFALLVGAAALNPNYPPEALAAVALALAAASAWCLVLGGVLRGSLEQLERRDAELAEARARLDLLSRGANDALWEWDLQQGRATYSLRWQALLGLEGSPGETMDGWMDRVHAADLDRLRADLADHVAGRTPSFRNAHRVSRSDGTVRWLEARGIARRGPDGRADRMAGSVTDITERKGYEDQLLHDAFHDHLTGLPNRPLFLNRLAHSIARAQRRPDYLFAVLYVDLDRFKVVNDSLGHEAGDDLLVQIARRLEACIRPGDTVARLGGDEFTVLLDDLEGPEEATRVADRIQQAMQPPFHTGSRDVVSSVSIGIALSSVGYFRPEELVRDADAAMHAAKADGKARYRVFERGMHEEALERVALEADLRAAVERGDFFVQFQPLIDLRAGRIIGFEALVRWAHPERGLIPPETFVQLAEEMGMIDRLSWFVLRTACRQARRWLDLFPLYEQLTLSVNISPRHFERPGLVEGVLGILAETGLPASALNLELTENVAIGGDDRTRGILAGLRTAGISLCIDDFGTGYAGLHYLQSLDVDGLKIDRSFVQRMTQDQVPKVIESIIALGRGLGHKVTAEGIETVEQAEQLRSLGCDNAQGYYFARPLDPGDTEALLARNPDWGEPFAVTTQPT